MIKVTAAGRLVRDAETFSYGRNMEKTGVHFDLACEVFGRDDPTFIRCNMWNRDSRFAEYLQQGNQCIVHGDLIIDNREDRRYVSINVDSFEFGAKKQ